MKNLKFKYAGAWNFLPFGPEGIELFFDKYKNIVLIKGENRDSKPIDSDEARASNNGSGKSSIIEILVWGLYGRTVKRPEKLAVDDVVHNKMKKDCKVEIIFDKYRIVRTRKKNSLRLWESEKEIWDDTTEITEGGMPATQKKIEDILGLSYDAFINIAVFTDDQRSCFLECDKNKKKEIVENMLSLGVYREWFENAKELKKEVKSNIDLKAKEFDMLSSNLKDANRRLLTTQQKEENWFIEKKKEVDLLNEKIKSKKLELNTTDNGAALALYLDAQAKIKSINESTPALEKEKEEINAKLQIAKNKENELKEEAQKYVRQQEDCATAAKSILNERKKLEAEIAKIEAKEIGIKCNECFEVIKGDNIESALKLRQEGISNLNSEIKDYLDKAKEIATKAEELKAKQTKVKGFITQFNTSLSSVEEKLRTMRNDLVKASQVREPKADSAELLLQQQLQTLNEQLENKKKEVSGPSPFVDIIENDKKEIEKIKSSVEEKDAEVKALEADLPYYEYWLSGFGETGIRKWVVDGIIPELNNRVDYWLQFLIDNKISLKFDNELTELIERNPVDGDPYVYHAMSAGQRRRLNLAVSQSFAHIMSMSSGSIPSIAFLDEISTNVDPVGVIGIYNMICELAETKQIFITTHDPDLMRMLEGSNTINLIHENGFTKMA